MTPGCPGCEAMSRGGTARGHSEACRQRVETDMKARGHQAFQRAEDRMMSRLAEQLEAHDAEQAEDKQEDAPDNQDAAQEGEIQSTEGKT